MNKLSCSVCDDPCARVCIHPSCTFPPFCCKGDCNGKLSSTTLHNHNDEQKIISQDAYLLKLLAIKISLDSYELHKTYVNKIKKQIILVKSHLYAQIEKLQDLMNQLETSLYDPQLQLVLNEGCEKIINKIQSSNYKALKGKQLYRLFSGQFQRFVNENQTKEKMSRIKSDFQKGLQELKKFTINKYFVNYKIKEERASKFNVLYQKGKKQYQNKQFRSAQQTFIKAKQYSSRTQVMQRIKDCQTELKHINDQERRYQQKVSRQTNQKKKNIFATMINPTKTDQHIDYYQSLIRKDPKNPQYYSKLAHHYLQIKNNQLALFNFLKANELQPSNTYYKKKIDQLMSPPVPAPQTKKDSASPMGLIFSQIIKKIL